MDIRSKLIEELNNNRDIILTLPKSVKWEDYEKELEKVKDWKEVLNFKVNHLPKIKPQHSKCYLIHNGFIKGYMLVVGLVEDNFTCTTTGKEWSGKFIQRSGPFIKLKKEIPMKGFQGYRYFNILDYE